jgi:hypothetical protein
MFFDILARNNLLIFFRNYFLDFVCLLYIWLLSYVNHDFQGLDTMAPTLVVGEDMKMVSHDLVIFSVLCNLYHVFGWVVT